MRATMGRYGLPVLILGLANRLLAEDFVWSWEQGQAEKDEGSQAVAGSTSAPPAEGFTWSWESSKKEGTGGADRAGGLDAKAYQELIRENLALRKQMEELTGREAAAKREADRLAREVRDLESRIAEFTARIEALNRERAAQRLAVSPVDPDGMVRLESQLAVAEREKRRLEEELAALRQAAAAGSAAQVTAAVQPGSDLFRQMEKENAALREEIARLRAEKEAAVAEQSRAADWGRQTEAERNALRARAERAEQAERKYREALQRILDRLPSLEKELVSLRDSMKRKETALSERERELEVLKAELDRREQRLIKAERMLTLLARTQMEVMTAADTEKRDLHYNMGVAYAREGRFQEAEREYLKALRLDPSDAATHYNLAILYDDVLGNKRRAVLHYRKYLSLSPHSEDVDNVRLWLMQAEMEQ